MQTKRIIVIGGGTFNPISNHMSLAAPAFGSTAKTLVEKINKTENMSAELVLTKMADPKSKILSNKDLSEYIDSILDDMSINGIIMNAAVTDYEYKGGDFHGNRLESRKGDITLNFNPSDKIIGKIRLKRPDIFLVGFKTTTNASIPTMFEKGLKSMKSNKCNLMFCNDVVARKNFIITAEETKYHITSDRNEALDGLVDILGKRINGTYERTKLIENENLFLDRKGTMYKVLDYLIENGGFLCNNGNGFTNGHFCQRVELMDTTLVKKAGLNREPDIIFLSSIRKRNHNKVFREGMVLVMPTEEGAFTVLGNGKPSVGARSQYMLLKENPDMDCIIHTHNPLTEWSELNTVPQYPFQCGSNECGMNTVQGLREYKVGHSTIKAVYLDKHGANIMFNSTDNPEDVIKFIQDNLQLGVKTT